MREADELGDDGVEDAERVREIDASVDLNVIPLPHAPGGAGEVAKAIDRETHGLIKAGNQKRGGQMGEVMLHAMHLGTEVFTRERGLNGTLKGTGAFDVGEALEDETEAGALAQNVQRTTQVVDLGITVDGDVIDIPQREARVGQTPLHGLGGQAGPVFDAAEALLFSGGDEFAVFDEGGSGVAMVGVETEDDH